MFPSPVRLRLVTGYCIALSLLAGWDHGMAGPASAQPASRILVDARSIVNLTFEHNLRVTAERYNVESAELLFDRFVRSQSQFIPLIAQAGAEQEAESELVDGRREEEREREGAVSLGMEKEFFDGTIIEGHGGMRATEDRLGRDTNPFVELGLRIPLFASFTRLERITERTFEESEMLEAWLDFIDTLREAINTSQQAYFELQEELGARDLAERIIHDLRQLADEPYVIARPSELAQIEAQLQSYQSEITQGDGNIDSARIGLLDNIGLETLSLDEVRRADLYAEKYYGAHYLEMGIEELIAEAVRNDVEIQVLEIARKNAELKRQLAINGRWDIIGRLSGGYDFPSRGVNPARPGGYRAGLSMSVQRNDPKLLSISLRQSAAEMRKFGAQVAYRERQLQNEIRRNLVQAANARRVIQELMAGRELRRAVYEIKRTDYLAGADTVDNLLQTRSQLYNLEDDLLEELIEFYEIIIDLDEATGQYFVQLGDAVQQFERMSPNGGPGWSAGSRTR
jgi:outer membrane protein TolC